MRALFRFSNRFGSGWFWGGFFGLPTGTSCLVLTVCGVKTRPKSDHLPYIRTMGWMSSLCVTFTVMWRLAQRNRLKASEPHWPVLVGSPRVDLFPPAAGKASAVAVIHQCQPDPGLDEGRACSSPSWGSVVTHSLSELVFRASTS